MWSCCPGPSLIILCKQNAPAPSLPTSPRRRNRSALLQTRHEACKKRPPTRLRQQWSRPRNRRPAKTRYNVLRLLLRRHSKTSNRRNLRQTLRHWDALVLSHGRGGHNLVLGAYGGQCRLFPQHQHQTKILPLLLLSLPPQNGLSRETRSLNLSARRIPPGSNKHQTAELGRRHIGGIRRTTLLMSARYLEESNCQVCRGSQPPSLKCRVRLRRAYAQALPPEPALSAAAQLSATASPRIHPYLAVMRSLQRFGRLCQCWTHKSLPRLRSKGHRPMEWTRLGQCEDWPCHRRKGGYRQSVQSALPPPPRAWEASYKAQCSSAAIA